MRKASTAICLLLIFFVSGTSFIRAQDQTGTIQGTVVDKSGKFIAGATVYLSSPAMLGMQILMTGKNGGFDFPALASGVYTISAEIPGYQTVVRDQIILHTGMSYFISLELKSSEQEVEDVAHSTLHGLDAISSKKAYVMGQALIGNVPLARDFKDVLNIAPGVISSGITLNQETSISGGTVRDNVYVLDGVNLTDMFTAAPLLNLNFDQIEEIEIISAGKPASQLPAGGVYVNVVSKSGSNSFAGELGLHFMYNDMNKDLWTLAQIKELGVSRPAGEKNFIEPSLSFGGPFWAERVWYFFSGRSLNKSLNGNFVGPFVDVLGRQDDNYDWSRRDMSGFFKLSVRPYPNAKVTAWINMADAYQSVDEAPSPRLPFLSTKILDHDKSFALHGILDYGINQNTQAFIRAAYVNRNIPTHLQDGALNLPWTDDVGDLYGPLSGADYNSEINRKRIQAEASLRIFSENFLGTYHTFNVGADFDESTSTIDWWRQDNRLTYLDSRNPNNYFYGDRGLMAFWICGTEQGSTLLTGQKERVGVYATDSFTVAKKLTFNLGLRFDRAWGWFPSGSKTVSGDPLSVFIGDAYFSSYLKALYPNDFSSGFNPWGAYSTAEQDDFISWNALSPSVGLAYDIWGNGKTVLKASYARYAEDLSFRYLLPLNPLYPQNFTVNWTDANGNGLADQEDEFQVSLLDLRYLSGSFNKNRVASSIKAPVTEEISIGLEHEIIKDLTFGLHFISKNQMNILEDVLYNPDTGEYWYSLEQAAAQKYWIPFTTTVPGTGSYPSRTVTLYAKSLQAPPVFMQLRNVPELERKYRALEFAFQKRMARGWQLAGSLVLSKTEGNVGGFIDETTALTEAGNSPNYFINRYGRLDTDRPVQIKLMGTMELPFRINLSAFFHFQSGRPWQRSVQILPPADWCSAHNIERTYYTVNLEAPGSRREKAESSLDLRMQKEWSMGASGKIGLFADVTNLLGFTASSIGLNDIDRWEPAAVGAGQPGVKYLLPDYQVTSAVFGKRTVRIGFRLDF